MGDVREAIYQEAAEAAGVPENMREAIVRETREDMHEQEVRRIADHMHELVMDSQ